MNVLSLTKRFLLLSAVVFFASCDKEFNTIGSDIVGENYFEFEKENFEVKAANFLTGPVQTNNLPLNSLGTYTDPAMGTTTSHFVTQAELQIANVTVNPHPEIDSVWVYVPFFSTATGTNSDGVRTFTLDSIYGDEDNTPIALQKFRLKVYENGYYLGGYDPDNNFGTQRFYSDDKNKIESNLIGASAVNMPVPNGQPLNNGLAAENEDFFFNNEERIIYKTNGNGLYVDAAGELLDDQDNIADRVVKERFIPGIWINLNKDYFENKILKAPADKLKNNNAFKEYFRGLYFQAQATGSGPGSLASLDFSKGYIKMTYKMDTPTDDDSDPNNHTATRLKRFLVLKLGGNCINFFDHTPTLPADPSTRLRLKGGNGSVAYVDLFDETEDANLNGVPDDLDNLRASGWLINEANLTFYIDDNTIDGMGQDTDRQVEPNRIYVYDYKNKRPILDYFADGSTNSTKPKYSKRGFGGIIEKNAAGQGVRYKIRVTEHIKSLIKHHDSTNYRLGVAITENINLSTNAYIKPPLGVEPDAVVPLSSVISPLGTILHGPNSEDSNKKLKLEIYYTKPD